MARKPIYMSLMIAAGASQPAIAAGVDMSCQLCSSVPARPLRIAGEQMRWKPASLGTDYRALFSPKADRDVQGEWVRRRKSVSIGDDRSRFSLQAERSYARKRKSMAGLAPGRQRLSSIVLGMRYEVDPGDSDHFSLAVSRGQDKRRFDVDLTNGHWSSSHFVEARADWIHDRHWRLSAAYSASQGDGRLTGLQRSVQLVHGATASRSGFRLATDYSPSGFRADTPFSIGLVAGSDRLSGTDAMSFGMRGRTDSRLALDLRLRF